MKDIMSKCIDQWNKLNNNAKIFVCALAVLIIYGIIFG